MVGLRATLFAATLLLLFPVFAVAESEIASTTSETLQAEQAASQPSATTTEDNAQPKSEQETSAQQASLLEESPAPVVTEITQDTTLAAGTYSFDALVIKSGATLYLQGDPRSAEEFKGVRIEANSITIEAGGAIHADQQGYDSQTRGPGSPTPDNYMTGASHGGLGFGLNPAPLYDSARFPRELGSFASRSRGGGAVELVVAGETSIDGTITANAGASASGGSILIRTNSFSGTGMLQAKGGYADATSVFIGPGGGGRIAVHAATFDFSGDADARGGLWPGVGSGESGTVGFFDTENDILNVGHAWRFEEIDAPHSYLLVKASDSIVRVAPEQELTISRLELSNSSIFVTGEGHDLSINELVLSQNSLMQLREGAPLKVRDLLLRNQSQIKAELLAHLVIEADIVSIGPDASISASKTGYGNEGPGSPSVEDYRTGASHGGLGYGGNPKPVYGSPSMPTEFGSGAHNSKRGGGAIHITASDLLENYGVIDADADGSGSGGSIFIEANALSGTGKITANGGDLSSTAEFVGPGAGGRIAIYYGNANDWSGTAEAKGGLWPGIARAGEGTVVFEQKTFCAENCFSNVLFLPGIMGSHLYEKSDACGFGSDEKQRWFSFDDCDQLRLVTDANGNSINDIYTKEGSVIDETFGVELYTNFLSSLENWKTEGIYEDYAAIPYDWRMKLPEIITAQKSPNSSEIHPNTNGSYKDGYLYKTFKSLAESSRNGKVTIVSHSNGGLVAKQFVQTLQDNNDSLVDQIDNLILVAVPQAGTPESMVSILHGVTLDYVLSAEIARTLTNTGSFSYHLLPGENYFQGDVSVQTPVISFEDGAVTTPLGNTFGQTITGHDAMYRFIGPESGRTSPSESDVLHPAIAQQSLLNYADEINVAQRNWSAPTSTKVFQIGGAGVPTVAGISYFTDLSCTGWNAFRPFRCSAYGPKLGYRINDVIDGDGTVVTPSALVMAQTSPGIKRLWVDLLSHNNNQTPQQHRSILEVDDIIQFIEDKVRVIDSSTYTYIKEIAPDYSNAQRLVFQLHSPLDMRIVSADGSEVSSTTNTISGAVYRRFGEVQFISLPSTATQKTLVLTGMASGSFTLDTEQREGDILKSRQTYSAIPSATSTRVELVFSTTTSLKGALLAVDYDGNNEVEAYYDTTGEVALYTYESLFDILYALQAPQKQSLIAIATAAKKQHDKVISDSKSRQLELGSLASLKRQIILYEERGFIEYESILALQKNIDHLINP